MSNAALVAGGAVAGGVLAGTLSAGAATTLTNAVTTAANGYTGQAGGPGVQENDGIPESQEHHGGALNSTGAVTAVGSSSVTIKDSTGKTTTYTVDSSSDIDKSGEAQLSNIAVGDAVTFSVRPGTTTIDKLHTGDESKNMPAPRGNSGSAPSTGSSTGSSAGSGGDSSA
jgi:hypothetical protein